MNQQRRHPFSVVAHNATSSDGTEEQKQIGNVKESDGAQNSSSCCVSIKLQT
jgi:myb proto-oncogene protein